MFSQEAVDCSLKVHDRVEHAALQPALAQLGEEPLDGVQPGARGRREMKGPARMTIKPTANHRMFVHGIIAQDNVDDLACGNLGLDGVQETGELLISMTLHVSADDRAIADVQRGEQGGRSEPLVIVRHGPGATLVERQARLGAVERPDLDLLIDGQNDGVRRRIDIGPDYVAQFGYEVRVIGKLELPAPMRFEAMGAPDALLRTYRNARGSGHHRSGPVGRLAKWLMKRQGDDLFGDICAERRNARAARLGAQKAAVSFLRELFLPAPDADLGFVRAPHALVRADPVGAQQNDLGPPDMLLDRVTVIDEGLQPCAVWRRDRNGDTSAHAEDTHMRAGGGIPHRTQMSDFIH